MREKIERETRDADGEGTSTGTSDFVRDAVKDFMGAFGGASSLGSIIYWSGDEDVSRFFQAQWIRSRRRV